MRSFSFNTGIPRGSVRYVVHFDRMKPCTVLASEKNVAPAKDDNTGVPAVARGLLHSNGDVGEDQLRDEVEVEIRATVPETHPVGELLPVAEPPPVHVAVVSYPDPNVRNDDYRLQYNITYRGSGNEVVGNGS